MAHLLREVRWNWISLTAVIIVYILFHSSFRWFTYVQRSSKQGNPVIKNLSNLTEMSADSIAIIKWGVYILTVFLQAISNSNCGVWHSVLIHQLYNLLKMAVDTLVGAKLSKIILTLRIRNKITYNKISYCRNIILHEHRINNTLEQDEQCLQMQTIPKSQLRHP